MQFFNIVALLALAGVPVLAAPAADISTIDTNGLNELEARVTKTKTLTCRTKMQHTGKAKVYKVDEAVAKAQIQSAGFKEGKSGYPHHFGNKEQIKWNVHNCDAQNANLIEYPVFWKDAKNHPEWKKEVLVKQQAKSPVRVVFANKGGAATYCGVMVHIEVNQKDEATHSDFSKCT